MCVCVCVCVCVCACVCVCVCVCACVCVFVHEMVDSESNPADMLTKGMNGDKIQKYTRVLGFRLRPGRHELMPMLRIAKALTYVYFSVCG